MKHEGDFDCCSGCTSSCTLRFACSRPVIVMPTDDEIIDSALAEYTAALVRADTQYETDLLDALRRRERAQEDAKRVRRLRLSGLKG